MGKKILALIFTVSCLISPSLALSAEEAAAPATDIVAAPAAPKSGVIEPEEGLEMLLFNPIITTASKVEEKMSDAPGVISVVTKDELMRFGGTTLKDILERVPGLVRSTVYFTDRSVISIRGAQFKENGVHMLLLLNGRPIREGLEGGIVSEVLESFPVNVIDKIEVIKGPGSVLYGTGAFDGVINIITEKAEKTGGTVTALAGEAGAYDLMAKGTVKAGDFSMVVAGKYHKRPDWDVPLEYIDLTELWIFGRPTVCKDIFTTRDIGSGAYAEVNYGNLKLMTSFENWESMTFQPDYAHFPFAPFSSFYGKVTWEKQFADLGYTQKINDIWKMGFNLTYTGSKLEAFKFPYVIRDSYYLTGEWTNYINPTDRLGIVVGGVFNYVKGTELFRGTMNEPPMTDFYCDNNFQNSYGFYTQADYWLQPDLFKLIAGIQVNQVEKLQADMVPRLGLIYYLAPSVNLKALYSNAFRAPTMNETSLTHPQLAGNPNLKSEKADTFDFGLNYNLEKFQYGVNFFYSKMTNIIRTNRTSGAPVPFYDNMSEISAQGAEFEGKYSLSKELLVQASILYQTSKDQTGAENVSPIANLGAKFGVSYMSENGVTLSLHNIYQGDLASKFATVNNPSPGAYDLLNFNSSFDMHKLAGLWQGLSLLLRAENLLDKELWLPNWGEGGVYSIPVLQGRVVYAGLEMSF